MGALVSNPHKVTLARASRIDWLNELFRNLPRDIPRTTRPRTQIPGVSAKLLSARVDFTPAGKVGYILRPILIGEVFPKNFPSLDTEAVCYSFFVKLFGSRKNQGSYTSQINRLPCLQNTGNIGAQEKHGRPEHSRQHRMPSPGVFYHCVAVIGKCIKPSPSM